MGKGLISQHSPTSLCQFSFSDSLRSWGLHCLYLLVVCLLCKLAFQFQIAKLQELVRRHDPIHQKEDVNLSVGSCAFPTSGTKD